MRVVAAMSGGVDSAVAAGRMLDAGHQVVGVHLALSQSAATLRESARGCCTIEDAGDARRVADVLGIPFYVWDMAERFKRDVMEDFVAEYAAGRTPNPCLRCNALADNRLYIADTFNSRVRCVELSSGLMTTMAGNGGVYRYESPSDAPSPSLSRPTGITFDREGRLFLTDSDNHLIRQWDEASGVAFCVAGQGVPSYSGDGGAAREASLCYPFGIVADRDGTLLVADTFNHRIRVLSLE